MSYKIVKPYTVEQKLDFKVKYGQNLGLRIRETACALYALEPNEMLEDGEVVINPDYEAELAEKERERLNNLSMTRGDVFEALILAKGLGKAQLRAMIEAYETDETTKALYLNRFDEALDFYRGYPIFDLLGEQIGVTSEMWDRFFESKEWEELVKLEEEFPPVEEVENNGAGQASDISSNSPANLDNRLNDKIEEVEE